jgi:hypothetical protein
LNSRGLAKGLCERIGETIAKVQASWMTAFAIDLEAALCELRLGFIERNDLEPDALEKSPGPRVTLGSISAHQNDRAVKGCACRHIPCIGLHNETKQLLSVRFMKQHRTKRRSIHHHQVGNPSSS